jgi:hypothetical protein
LNLNLFVNSINPAYKVSKKNETLIKALINKYVNDKSDSRLEAISSFIQPVKPENLINQSDINKLNGIVKKESSLTRPDLNSYRNIDKNADKQRRLEIFTSLFGKFEQEGTLAHSLINFNPVKVWSFTDNEMVDSRNFSNKSLMEPEKVIRWAEELSGQKIKNYYDIHINRVFMPGNLSGYGFKHNGLGDFRVFDNKGYDAQGTVLKGYNTVNSSTDMQSVFSSLEGVRRGMK